MDKNVQHVFIIGSKGIPGNYGGFETFADKLIEHSMEIDNIRYHVACRGNAAGEREYHKARCFYIRVPNMWAAQSIYYDIAALDACCHYIRENKIPHPIVYILAYRIGAFFSYYAGKIHRLGGKVYLNPDGHEWARGKWNVWVRMYWRYSERQMVRQADRVICDSKVIENYICQKYQKYSVGTEYISYGAEPFRKGKEEQWERWSQKWGIQENEYYLIVGRFVPENNFYFMLKEFHASDTAKKLIMITNPDNKKLMKSLMRIPGIREDERIKFAGTVYDEELLMQIRRNAFAYIHGHEVGGTNPGLLEAMACTNLNLLLCVDFNEEAAKDCALYWHKEEGSLRALMEQVEKMGGVQINALGQKARKHIAEFYNWSDVAEKYRTLFLKAFTDSVQ